MFKELLATKIDWTTLEGVILEGGYEVRKALEIKDSEATYKVRVLGAGGLEAVATFYQAPSSAASEQLSIWQSLRQIPHPNLSAPLSCGRRKVNRSDVVYVIMGLPDETLIEVLQDRPLTWEEAGELLRSIEQALAHLHAHGLAHGCVSPETIVAEGYSIQLWTQSVRKRNTRPPVQVLKPRYLAPESTDENITGPADVWCLGASLFEVLTQHKYGSHNAHLTADLPLAPVLRSLLAADPRSRSSLKETPAASASPAPVAEPPSPKSRNGASGSPVVDAPPLLKDDPQRPVRPVLRDDMALVPVGKRHRPVGAKRQPIEAKIKPGGRRIDDSGDPEPAYDPSLYANAYASAGRMWRLRSRSGAWRGIVAGSVGAVMLIALLWLVIIPRLTAPTEAVPAPPLQPAAIAAASPAPDSGKSTPGSTRTLPADPPVQNALPDARTGARVPEQTSSQPDAAESKPALADSTQDVSGLWRVVLYAYKHEADAERRVQLTNQNFPSLEVHVFVPLPGGPFLVVAGEAMNHADAEALRQKAIDLGIPRAPHLQSFDK